jgi:vacuolar-type H+-ATPase subunit C/Vma6
MNAPRRAYGLARIRARKSQLLDHDTLAALVAVDSPASTVPGWRDLDVNDDGSFLIALVYGRLVGHYDVALRAYPEAGATLRALVGFHEIENVKLLWRAAIRQVPFAEWRTCWRPLGPLATVAIDEYRSLASLRQLIAGLADTPYGELVDAEFRAHAQDLAAIEIGFDRKASEAALTAVEGLPHREGAARDLVRTVIRERDVALAVRVVGMLGVSPERAAAMTSVLGAEVGPQGIREVSAHHAVARRAMRMVRRRACRRAFLDDPFSLAPPIALALLCEDEARALLSLAEVRARHLSAVDVRRLQAIA